MAVQLVAKMILFNPRHRISAKDALKDDFFYDFKTTERCMTYLRDAQFEENALSSASFDDDQDCIKTKVNWLLCLGVVLIQYNCSS